MDWLDIVLDTLRNGLLVTGLVTVMMLLIEYLNVQTQGRWSHSLQGSGFKQVLLGALLGIIPGCMGGFAVVSLYTHGLVGFGALIAMMIASSGDEAFVMLATIPREALILSGVLLVLAIVVGLIVNLFSKKKTVAACDQPYEVHSCDEHHHDAEGHCAPDADCPHASLRNLKHASWQRIVLLLSVLFFALALAFGWLEHEHEGEGAEHAGHLAILDEYWLNLLFAVISLFVVWVIASAKEHFVHEHLWNHVIRKHLLRVFCWTFGTMLLINIGLEFLDIEAFVNSNGYIVPLMILLAALIGIIPESGPHLLFVTLFATGVAPFSVLLASSISQDGHAGLPLLAESKGGFLKAKLLNVAIALACGFVLYAFGL